MKYNFSKDVKEVLTTTEKTFVGKNGKEYKFIIDNIFSEAKKTLFIREMINILKECSERKENPDYLVIFEYLLVKHFTNVLEGLKAKNIYELTVKGIDELSKIQELGFYPDLILSLNTKEIEKMNKEFNLTIKNMKQVVDKFKESVNENGKVGNTNN